MTSLSIGARRRTGQGRDLEAPLEELRGLSKQIEEVEHECKDGGIALVGRVGAASSGFEASRPCARRLATSLFGRRYTSPHRFAIGSTRLEPCWAS